MASTMEQRTAYYNGVAFELLSRESAARELSYPAEQPERRPAAQPAARPKTNRLASIVLVTAVVAFVAILVVFAYGRLYQVTSEVDRQKSTLAELQEQKIKLAGQYNNMIDYRAIEADAIGRLGMMKPSSGQTVYVNLAGADRGEVLTGSHESLLEQGASLVEEAFSGLAAYFR